MNILFVCTGNTCRSPMAEKMLQKIAKDKQIDISVKSAGVAAIEGHPASNHAQAVLKKYGTDYDHKTKKVDEVLMDWADIILTMTTGHKELLLRHFPNRAEKVYALKEYAMEINEEYEERNKINVLYQQIEEKKQAFFKDHEADIQRLQEQYSHYQKKLKEVEGELNSYQKRLNDFVREELQEIERIEQQLPSLDIADPFGGDLKEYEKTANEIEKYLRKLIHHLD